MRLLKIDPLSVWRRKSQTLEIGEWEYLIAALSYEGVHDLGEVASLRRDEEVSFQVLEEPGKQGHAPFFHIFPVWDGPVGLEEVVYEGAVFGCEDFAQHEGVPKIGIWVT